MRSRLSNVLIILAAVALAGCTVNLREALEVVDREPKATVSAEPVISVPEHSVQAKPVPAKRGTPPVPAPRPAGLRVAERQATPVQKKPAEAASAPPATDLKPARRQPAATSTQRFSGLSRPPRTAKNPGSADADKPVDASWLVGLDQDGALVLLGQPSQRRDQPPARIWQYNADRCSLKLFLYLDVVTVRYRTLFYEIDGVDAEDSNARRHCLNQILAGRADRRNDG
jgi:hypothetical protein